MSRYYKIVVGTGDSATTWTNMNADGSCILGAQTVELDLPVTAMHAPDSSAQAFVRIWGVTREQISQASNFNGQQISVYGGMMTGLPLATADAPQAGLLIQGTVLAGFGNWQGTAQSLDLLINANDTPDSTGTPQPVNLAFSWLKGTSCSQMLQTALGAAFPTATININISPNLVLSNDEHGVYQDLAQFAKYINAITKPILGGKYGGVLIVANTNNADINVTDNSSDASAPTNALDGDDLVGQVTWQNVTDIQFSTVMRSDLQVGNIVTFPQYVFAQAVTTASSQSNARNSITFTGKFFINRIQHFGNSRDPDAQSWITSIQASENPGDATADPNASTDSTQ